MSDPTTAAVGTEPSDTSEPLGPHVSRTAGATLLVAGAIGLLASFTLTVERFHLLTDATYRPSCNLNPIISCGSVMVTDQAAVFGFPNPLIGLAAFPVVIVTGLLTTTRIVLPRWYWVGQTLCSAAGFTLVNWLAFQSIFRIGALCPYCMAVWVIMPVILQLSLGRLLDRSRRQREMRSWLWVIVVVWYSLVLVAIGVEFADYWSTLL